MDWRSDQGVQVSEGRLKTDVTNLILVDWRSDPHKAEAAKAEAEHVTNLILVDWRSDPKFADGKIAQIPVTNLILVDWRSDHQAKRAEAAILLQEPICHKPYFSGLEV